MKSGPRPLILRAVHALEDALVTVLLSFMILLAFAQIVLRNAAGIGLFWSDPLLRYLVLWIGLLGAMIATREDYHISVDVVSYFLPPRGRACVRVITDLFTAAVCLLLTKAAVDFVQSEKEWGMTILGGFPAWVAELILPVAFGVMGIRYLVHCGVHLHEALSGVRLRESGKPNREAGGPGEPWEDNP